MKNLALVASLVSIILCSGCDGDDDDRPDRVVNDDPQEIPFDSVSCPAASSHTLMEYNESLEPREDLFREPHEFREFYLTVDPNRQDGLPTIDFDEKLAIFLFMGRQPDTNPQIRMGSVTETDSSIIVEYENVIPPEGCPGDTSLRYPYCIITVDQTEKRVEFVSETVEECIRP